MDDCSIFDQKLPCDSIAEKRRKRYEEHAKRREYLRESTLRMKRKGYTNATIAQQLKISEAIVYNILKNA